MPSTGNFSEPLERLKKALDGAGAVSETVEQPVGIRPARWS